MRILEQPFRSFRNVWPSLMAMLIRPRQKHCGTALALIVLLCTPLLAEAQPLIQSIDPPQGPIAGSTRVTLTGSGFTGATLMLDSTIITPNSLSDNQIVFQTPAHDNGIATIKLSGNGPTAYTEFLYVPPRLQDLPPGYITTVAGFGLYTGLYRQATQAEIQPQGSPAYDRQGNLYIPEPAYNRVIRVRPDGILEPFAGTGLSDYQSPSGIGDGGPATQASLTFPRGVAIDAAGNAYITEAKYRVRRVDAQTGIITTLAGNSTPGFSGDGGPAVQARISSASHITCDSQGTVFFIDYELNTGIARVRKVTVDGIISTVAGTGPPGFSGDGGPATQAQFNLIFSDRGSLALDSQGNLFIEDSGNDRIRRIDGRSGVITTVYGPASIGWGGVTADQSGNIVFWHDSRISKMDPSGLIINTYGSATQSSNVPEDGTSIQNASIRSWGLTIDPSGNIVYVETNRARRLNLSTGLVETLAGMGTSIIGDNGPAISTTLPSATDLTFLPSGELLIGDTGHFVIRKLDGNGNISTLTKNGWPTFDRPVAIESDKIGNVYVADMWNVYRIDSNGTSSLIVGPKQKYGFSGDGGPATQALLCEPFDVAVDGAGNFFIADSTNNRIRRVDGQTGIITTVAGSGPVSGFEKFEADGQGSYTGDGGPATQATLNTPYGVAVDSQGNLFIGDGGNRRIRKVDVNGIITTFSDSTELLSVNRLAFDGAGNLYTVTSKGLFRFDSTGKSTKIAGQWPPGFSGDGGPALLARTRTLAQSAGVAIDAEGNVFFVDPGNLRVRAVRFGALIAGQGSTVAVSGDSAQTTLAGTAFPTALQISLKLSDGTPASSVRVDFNAPASGSTCVFANSSPTFSTLTDINGYASAICTANSQLGSYNVTATPLALGQSAKFTLTNAKKLMISGGGQVTSTLLGIDCSSSCSPEIAEGTNVTFSAIPGVDQSFLGWSGACSGTASTCTFTASASTWVGASFSGIALDMVKGWNLVGNSFAVPISVANIFNDAAKVVTIWKWMTNGTTPGISYPNWAFYTPAQSDGGKAFAASRGYDFLTTIPGGDGFWVNAKTAFTAQLPGVTKMNSSVFKNLSAGWHLIATGDLPSPSEFNIALSASPPPAGTVPQNLTSLWAWDSSQSKWYFHAPSLETQGGTSLTDYIAGKGYLDFTATGKTLGQGTGFWVNKP